MAEKYLDRQETDGTSNAHPSYWRGRARGTSEMLKIIKNIASGEDSGEGTINSPVIESARRAILIYREALTHAAGKSTFLSKQAQEALEKAEKEVEKIIY